MKISNPAIKMLSLVALSLPTLVSAANICWVEQATRVDEGVKVRLSQRANVRVMIPMRTNAAGQRVDIHGNPLHQDSQIGVVKDGTFIIETGDTVLLSQMAEDACSLHVEVRDAQLGVVLSAKMHLPGTQPLTRSEFVSAQ